MNILVVGAGLAGCTCARLLAEADHQVYLIEKDKQIGGICRDERDEEHNCFVHTCGPHIFHTDDEWVWSFINRFSPMREYQHFVKTYFQVHDHPLHRISDFPINYNTLSDFFDAPIATEKAAKKWMEPLKIDNPKNFEEACLADVGPLVYKEFFWWYTRAQWKRDPKDLPVSFYKRVAVKFNKDPYLFPDKYQGLPTNGYTGLMKKMLEHDNISVYTDTAFETFTEAEAYDLVIYTGGFNGLPYRSTRFMFANEREATYPVVNLPGHLAFTRKTCYNILHPIDPTVRPKPMFIVGYEMPEKDNLLNQVLPIPTEENLQKYKEASSEFLHKHPNAVLLGRLASYQYLDMDDVILQCKNILKSKNLIQI